MSAPRLCSWLGMLCDIWGVGPPWLNCSGHTLRLLVHYGVKSLCSTQPPTMDWTLRHRQLNKPSLHHVVSVRVRSERYKSNTEGLLHFSSMPLRSWHPRTTCSCKLESFYLRYSLVIPTSCLWNTHWYFFYLSNSSWDFLVSVLRPPVGCNDRCARHWRGRLEVSSGKFSFSEQPEQAWRFSSTVQMTQAVANDLFIFDLLLPMIFIKSK